MIPPLLNDDVALIELVEPLPFSERIRPICLSSLNVNATGEMGRGAVITGYGELTTSGYMDSLHEARVDVAPVNYCSEYAII
jgi:hypothetical protein